jgi:hypothetical protein
MVRAVPGGAGPRGSRRSELSRRAGQRRALIATLGNSLTSRARRSAARWPRRGLAWQDHIARVTTDHPVRLHTAAMDTSTSRAPVAVARVARALTCLVYGFLLVALVGLLFGFLALLFGGLAALLLHALIEWLTDRIAEMGYAR